MLFYASQKCRVNILIRTGIVWHTYNVRNQNMVNSTILDGLYDGYRILIGVLYKEFWNVVLEESTIKMLSYEHWNDYSCS